MHSGILMPGSARGAFRAAQTTDAASRSRSAAESNSRTMSEPVPWTSIPGRQPFVRHTRPTTLGVDRRTAQVAGAALVPDAHQRDFALVVDGDRTGPGLTQGQVFAADLPVPAGGDLLAGAERSGRELPFARLAAHDRVADALPEQQHEPQQRRESDEQPRVVAGRLGRRVRVERFERARSADTSERVPGHLDVAGGHRSRREDGDGQVRVLRVTQDIRDIPRAGHVGRLQVAFEPQPRRPVRVEPVAQFLEGALQRDRAERDDHERDCAQDEQTGHDQARSPGGPAALADDRVRAPGDSQREIDRCHGRAVMGSGGA